MHSHRIGIHHGRTKEHGPPEGLLQYKTHWNVKGTLQEHYSTSIWNLLVHAKLKENDRHFSLKVPILRQNSWWDLCVCHDPRHTWRWNDGPRSQNVWPGRRLLYRPELSPAAFFSTSSQIALYKAWQSKGAQNSSLASCKGSAPLREFGSPTVGDPLVWNAFHHLADCSASKPRQLNFPCFWKWSASICSPRKEGPWQMFEAWGWISNIPHSKFHFCWAVPRLLAQVNKMVKRAIMSFRV